VKSIGVLNMIDMLSGKNYMYMPCEENEEILKEMLIGHTIKKVKEDTLELDNGTKLIFKGNEGCICGAGDYDITELNEVDNVITDVSFNTINKDNYDGEHSYQIFVYAENKETKLLQCDGDDGNGYYGTGYHIDIVLKGSDKE
jgi:hypothetical protein